MTPEMLAGLRPWASTRQAELLEAILAHGSLRAAAKSIGMDWRNAYRSIKLLKKRAAAAGYAPEHDMTRTVPEPFIVKGVSTYYNKDGKPTGQWVKSKLDDAHRLEAMRAAIESMAAEVPAIAATPAPLVSDADLLTLYTMTDCHVGMLAWPPETGGAWDVDIAERVLTGCFSAMVDAAPASGTAVIAQLGDWLHYDSFRPETPTSRHLLDADTRFEKTVTVGVRILRRLVDLALAKHTRVILLCAEGNHDMASSVWMRIMFGQVYGAEPRVEVLQSPLPFYVVEHGNVLLGFHHGHLVKNASLPALFATEFREHWGRCGKVYIHTGDKHHIEERDSRGVRIIQHPTLAARDAYASRGGWLSARQAAAITYHRQFGEFCRHIITPAMLEMPNVD